MCGQPDSQAQGEALDAKFRELYTMFKGFMLEWFDWDNISDEEIDKDFWEELQRQWADLQREQSLSQNREHAVDA